MTQLNHSTIRLQSSESAGERRCSERDAHPKTAEPFLPSPGKAIDPSWGERATIFQTQDNIYVSANVDEAAVATLLVEAYPRHDSLSIVSCPEQLNRVPCPLVGWSVGHH